MPRLTSVEDLRELRAQLVSKVAQRYDVGTLLVVGMGTCGIQAGARETLLALMDELARRDIDARLTHGGCINQCAHEPLVTIHRADAPPVTYGKITADKVPELVERHLVQQQTIQEWVVTTS